MTKKIAYVEHPVTPQEKQEIHAQGYQVIIDLKFKPEFLRDNEKIFTKQKKRKPLADM